MGINTIDRSSDQFLLDAYTGKGGFQTGAYLVRHGRETDDKFKERQALAEYPNYVRKIINIYSGFLFQAPPNRETSDTYAQFAANADGAGAGASIDMLMLNYQRLAMLVGTVYLIVDKPEGQAQTRADEKLPYLAMRMPGEIARWQMDDKGRLTSITFSEQVDIGSAGAKVRYRTFTVDGWMVHEEVNGDSVIDQGEHKLGRVPVVKLHSTLPLRTTDLRATPWSHDITQANWALYNQLSEMRELFRKQTFSILTLPVTSEDEAQRLQKMTVGTDNALLFNPTGGGVPAYIAPSADPAELYMKAIEGSLIRIYQQANLEFVGGVASSGVERKYQFAQTNRSLVEMAMLAEQAEMEIAGLVAAWHGQEATGQRITYPRDFDLSDLAADIQEALDSQTLGVSTTFDQEVKKRVARRMLGHGVSQATLEQIDNEIEGGADPYGDRIAKQAGGAGVQA
jgi:hypothetical protein